MPKPDLWIDPSADPTDGRCQQCGIKLDQTPMPQCDQTPMPQCEKPADHA